jgi:hypothetical protein
VLPDEPLLAELLGPAALLEARWSMSSRSVQMSRETTSVSRTWSGWALKPGKNLGSAGCRADHVVAGDERAGVDACWRNATPSSEGTPEVRRGDLGVVVVGLAAPVVPVDEVDDVELCGFVEEAVDSVSKTIMRAPIGNRR